MALFNFNFHGYDYEHGIMILSDSLLAATEALNAKSEAISADWRKYEADVANGLIEEIQERDEDTGQLLWTQSQFYEHDLDLISEGIQALRKAHVTALYHHWERIICRWTDVRTKLDHKRMVARLEAKGITPAARLNDIYNLNNVLKHDSETSGPALLLGWPEMYWNADTLRKRYDKGDKRIRWSDSVAIGSGHMDEIFAAMRSSGPVAR